MGTGDTHPGAVRYVLRDTQGNENVVFGSVPQDQLDYVNNTVSPDEKTYVNTRRASQVAAPDGSKTRSAPNAVFEAGEELLIQHKASSTTTNDIDHDFDGFTVEGVTVDLNRDNSFIDVKTVSDQELSADPAEATDEWVTFYKTTVGDRKRFLLAGEQEAVAVEN